MSATQITNWELRMKENVLNVFNRINERASVVQNRLNNLQRGFNGIVKESSMGSSAISKIFGKLDMGISGVMTKVEGMGKKVGSFLSNNIDSLKQSASMIPGVGGAIGMISNPIGLATVAALGLGTAMYKVTDMAIEFDKGMAKINNTAQLTRPELNKLRNELIALGQDSTVDLMKIPDAFEKIISQTGDTALSMDIMKSSLKAAEATFTDIDTIAGAVAQTLSVVGKQSTNANEVINTLIAAKRVGAGEFGDFAQYVPGLIAAGKNLNVAYKDTAGLFAYMTGKGQSAADSAMLIQNVFTALSKGEIRKGMAGAGIKLFNDRGELQRLDIIFSQMEQKLGAVSTKQKLSILEQMGLRDAQAKQGISVLMGDTDKLKEALDATNGALNFKSALGQVGELNAALAASETPSNRLAKDMNFFKGEALKVGNVLMGPVMKAASAIVGFIKDMVQGIKQVWQSSELLRDVFTGIGKLLQGMWAVIKYTVIEPVKWLWENIVKPMFKGVEYLYRLVKSAVTGEEFVNPFTETKSSNEGGGSADGQSAAEMALNNVNKGLPASGSGASLKESKSEGSVSGANGGGARILKMNLNFHNYIKGGADQDIQKLADKVMTKIIDAARDGIVTVGI